MQVRVSNWSLSLLPSPKPEFLHAPLPLYSATNQGSCPDSLFFRCFQFGTPIGIPQGIGSAPQITWSNFLGTIVPFDKIEDMIITHWLPLVTASRILTKNYIHSFCDWLCRPNGLTLLKILSFTTSHYATGMQLLVVCNYLGHVCNYKFSIV